MRRIAVLFVVLGTLCAEESPKGRARELEIEALRALEEGRRADALRLLKEAGDQRAGKTTPQVAPPRERAAAALAEMEAALDKGDAATALGAGKRARDALALWSLEVARAEEPPVEQRLDRLAKQIEELAKRYQR